MALAGQPAEGTELDGAAADGVLADEVRWLTDSEQRTWRRLGAVMILLPAALESQLHRDADLTHFAYWVLAMLSEAPGQAMRMSDLAALANGSQSRLSHLMSRLETAGWVTRTKAADDGRGYIATLTDAGRSKVVRAAPGHVAEVRARVFDALTPAQIDQLDAICATLVERLSTPGSCTGSPAPQPQPQRPDGALTVNAGDVSDVDT